MSKYLFVFFLFLPIEVFAERNISCDTTMGNFLYQVKDSNIDVFVSYADPAMYSIEIKSETEYFIYGERDLIHVNNEIQTYLFLKNKNKTVTSVKTYDFNVPELLKEKYLGLRIKQTLQDSSYYGKCFSL